MVYSLGERFGEMGLPHRCSPHGSGSRRMVAYTAKCSVGRIRDGVPAVRYDVLEALYGAPFVARLAGSDERARADCPRFSCPRPLAQHKAQDLR
jgi:hypothetical protein